MGKIFCTKKKKKPRFSFGHKYPQPLEDKNFVQNKILVGSLENLYTKYFEVKYTNCKDILWGKKLSLILFKNATNQKFSPKYPHEK